MLDLKADCVRRVANWSIVKPAHKFEKKTFDAEKVKDEMQTMSPKLVELLKKIQQLDEQDVAKDGRKYKHFIFSDVRQGGYGAKIISSALIASGYHLVYNHTLQLADDAQLLETKGENFALLCSTSVYDKPISVALKKKILSKYNQRDDNIHGDLIRIIVMDSGFKEGIDLFDVKYVHILEPQTSKADEKQVIGRGTRTCGQKGLQFQPNNGWTLEVYIYDVDVPQELADMMDARTLFQLYLKHSKIDLRKIAFANQLERMAIVGSVDYELNKNIHNFKVLGDDVDINDIFDNNLSGGAKKKNVPDMDKDINDIGFCTKNCGKRATKIVPFSTMKFAVAFFAMKQKLPKGFDSPSSLRDYFCNLMKKDDNYCASLHDLHDDMRAFMAKHAEELVYVVKNKDKLRIPKKYATLLRRFIIAYLPKEVKVKITPHPSEPESVRPPIPDSPNDDESVDPPSPDSAKSSEVPNPSAKQHENKGFLGTREEIKKKFSQFTWPKVELKNMCGGASIMNFNPTQDFVRTYFTPESQLKGMLLYHSVGTGKTCSAIAAATSTFEKEDYTILWVTRTTLKSDIWKNMFDQVCSIPIQVMIKEGKEIPEKMEDRMKLLGSSWAIRPMSYKQFSNLVAGKNEFYKRLVKKNGTKDPLKKTLLIIDEAHKLYGGADLSSVERPDMNKLKAALHKSYALSGKDSVKVMLMTATPYTNDPMELMQLLNLLRKKENQLPDDFEVFSNKYLDQDGNFTKQGHVRFLDDVSGYISYLNREKDARQFTQPVVLQVKVPMTRIDPLFGQENLENVVNAIDEIQSRAKHISFEIKEAKQRTKAEIKFIKDDCKNVSAPRGEKAVAKVRCLESKQSQINAIETQLRTSIDSLKNEQVSSKTELKTLRKKKTALKKEMKHDPSQESVIMTKCIKSGKTKSKSKKSDTSSASSDETI
jgi:superfamily II DNA or RNA helicase